MKHGERIGTVTDSILNSCH